MKILTTIETLGQRLDIFLTERITDQTRSQIKKQINQGLILINGQSTTPHYKLKVADLIEINESAPVAEPTEASPKTKITKVAAPKIIAVTADYIIVNKPAGLIVHGDKHIKETTLADLVTKKYPEIKIVGEDPYRPGIVHRLDKDVSGLMVIARTQEFFENLKQQFQDRTIDKKYSALVFGNIAKDEFTIDFPIERSSSGHKMAAKPLNQGGRTAVSKIKVKTRYINYTLVQVKIITGRTHQVRTHLAAYGTPIVGDNIYYTHTTKEKNKKLKTERVYLVADQLAFTDLQGERQSFKINLPTAFKDLLKKIK